MTSIPDLRASRPRPSSFVAAMSAMVFGITVMSCGGSAGNTGTGGHASSTGGKGGGRGAVGPGPASGGNTAGGTTATGGSQANGGTVGSGGTTATGGSQASGGTSGSGSGGGGGPGTGGVSGSGGATAMGGATGAGPVIGGCSILPSNHIFNTPVDALPVDPQSAAYVATIGAHNLHLDLGQSTDIAMVDTYYGIPYNIVHGETQAWAPVHFSSADPDVSWDPRPESDCVDAASAARHTEISPCTTAAAASPVFPIPVTPLVEGGIDTDPSQPYGDHHILLLDADTCVLSELYHAYPHAGGGWDIYGSAMFDLRSNKLRPDGWTSADAAGFPILPLLLRADEATAGQIDHALRFTITSSKIRNVPVWPARHFTSNGTLSTNLPPMGQLFRLKAAYQIPAGYNTQARAILQAMKTYGMYIADGGSDMYVTGEPSAAWADATFSQVQSVGTSQFEAVDLTPIHQRAGFDPDSAAVPPP